MNNKYTREEVQAASSEYFHGDSAAADVFVTKYALRDGEDNLVERTPDDSFVRCAVEFARIEKNYPNPVSYEKILSKFREWKILPQGSPLSGIGNPYRLQSLSNCFVISGVHDASLDSYGGIFKADQEQAQIMKRRGGVGFDISGIRPKGMKTNNAALTTDGIGVFMDRYSSTCREVAQKGRRGALMQTLSVTHPESQTFINIKRDRNRVTGANISLRFNDEFMHAVENNEEYCFRWPVEAPRGEERYSETKPAKDVWEQFVDAAWDCAEPGGLFWDTILRESPADCYADVGFKSISTNPCAEIIISCSDSCRLMVLNITKYVKNPFTTRAKFDYAEFRDDARLGQRLMDDLVDLEIESVEAIIQKVLQDPQPDNIKAVELQLWYDVKTAAENGRRTGLGLTGLGDALAMLGIRYGSQESIDTTGEIYRTLAVASYTESIHLAAERGAFPVYDFRKEVGHPYISRIFYELDTVTQLLYRQTGRRNIANLTTAPVGSLSMLTQTTSGCEPAFLLEYTRRRKITGADKADIRVDFTDDRGDRWHEYKVYHHGYKQWLDTPVEDRVPNPYDGATANDVDWRASVHLQAAAQRWVDHAISKTCNLPKDASHELVSEVYMLAWKLGCKGFTVYRDGARDGVLITEAGSKFDFKSRVSGVPIKELEETVRIAEKNASIMPQMHLDYIRDVKKFLAGEGMPGESKGRSVNHAPKRPKELPCDISWSTVKGESYVIMVGLLDDEPYELFCGLASTAPDLKRKVKSGKLVKVPKKGGDAVYDLVYGDSPDDVISDVVGTFNNSTHGAYTRTLSLTLRHGVPLQYIVEQLVKDKESDMHSFSKVIARVLKGYIKDGTASTAVKLCPNCSGTKFGYQEGCVGCLSCGWSKC